MLYRSSTASSSCKSGGSQTCTSGKADAGQVVVHDLQWLDYDCCRCGRFYWISRLQL